MQAIFSVKLCVQIGRFGNTVGVEINRITGCKLQLIPPVANTLHTCKHKACTGFEVFVCTVCVLYKGRIVTCVGKEYLAGLYVQNTHPSGNEHTCIVTFAELFICNGEHLLNAHARLGTALYDGLGLHHKHCRRDTLAGYVCHQECKVVIVNKIEIVEVAADLFCRVHRGVDFKFFSIGIRGENARQCGMLNRFCKGKLCIYAFLRFLDVTLQGIDRCVDIVRE